MSPAELYWFDVSNLDKLADEEERPEVAEWLRDLAKRLRAALHPKVEL